MAICHFLKPETNKGDFRLYFELDEKVVGGATTQKYQKQIKNLNIFYMDPPPGDPGVSKDAPGSTKHAS